MNKKLFAGTSKRDITPGSDILPLSFVFGYQINGVHDNINLRVLILKNEEKKVVFVTLDLPAIPEAERTMKTVKETLNLEEKDVFIAATHNHEGPFFISLSEETVNKEKLKIYYSQIEKALIEALLEAQNNLQPVKMGFSKGKSYINANRDEENGTSEPGYNFERPSDKTLNVLRFDNMEGKTVAFIINYAVHCTCVNGVSIGNVILISGDIAGNTSRKLEEKFDGAVALWTSGAAGDQNPRIPTQFGFTMDNGVLRVKNLGEPGYMILDYLVDEHVRDILKVNAIISCNETDTDIESKVTKIEVEGRNPLSENDCNVSPCPFTLRVISIGDTAILGVSAEVVTTIGENILKLSKFKNSFLITHVDNYCTGYVPDDWGYEHNTFEAKGAKMKKGCAEKALIKTFSEML